MITDELKASDVKEGDFFRLREDLGYTTEGCLIAMQVMECMNDVMTVKSSLNGCMTKPYNQFQKTDTASCRVVYPSSYFEDHRTLNKTE